MNASASSTLAALRAALRRRALALLVEALSDRAGAAQALREQVGGLTAEARAWREVGPALVRAGAALEAARLGPFTADMTVHRAWARHPGVRAIFTRRHLPACPQCAVGQDETLAEAAFGYDFDLDALLSELNALL